MVENEALQERHGMVRVDAAAWATSRPVLQDAREDAVVASWAAAGRPLVVRRRLCDDERGLVPLGLPLPPSLGKHRLSLGLPPSAIVSMTPPPLLRECASAAPPAWGRAIAALLVVDREVRCFGSLAWQYLTALEYVTPTSDLDLLWQAGDADAADRLADAIAGVAEKAGVRIDGELRMPSGAAVHWREWRGSEADVLVKSATAIAMRARADLRR